MRNILKNEYYLHKNEYYLHKNEYYLPYQKECISYNWYGGQQ